MTCRVRAAYDIEAFLVDPRGPEWETFRAHYPTCRECSAELAEWSELEAALGAAAAPSEGLHPGEDRLLAFQEDPARLAPAERDSIRDHLAVCVVCRDALDAVAGLGLGMGVPHLARAPSPAPPRRTRRWLGGSLPRQAFAAAAGLLVVLSIGWLLRSGLQRALDPVPTAPAPEVAAVEPPPRVEPSPRIEPSPPIESPRADVREKGATAPVAEEKPAPPAPAAEERRPAERPRAEASPAPRPAPAVQPSPKPAPEAKPPATRKPPAESLEPDADRALLIAALSAAGPPRYEAPPGATPYGRTGGVVRSRGSGLPSLLALAPDHAGRTLRESPTLYFFLSETARVPCELTLNHPGRDEPVLELTLQPPVKAGIHAVSLAEHGVVLEPGVPYRWFVSLVPDPAKRSSDVVAGGAIERIVAEEALRAELERADPARVGHVYASRGLFYDALAFVSGWIAEAPGEPRLREQRAALLEQVGLAEAAGYERRAAGGNRTP